MGEPGPVGVAPGGHEPVMIRQVVSLLACAPGRLYLDATLGDGGHAQAILEASAPTGRVVGLDWDAEAVARATRRLALYGERLTVVHDSFVNAPAALRALGVEVVDGIVADLGVSSRQLETAERGFSFQREGPLDMRMDRRRPTTAADLVNRLPAPALARLLREYGEERFALRIARAIVRARARAPLTTTLALARLVEQVIPRRAWPRQIHPATRTFQALRMAVNAETENLEAFLAALPRLLCPGGRAVVIAFHSLEDRLVKQAFRSGLRPLTRRPLRPEAEEVARNPRARSARLRAAERPAETETGPGRAAPGHEAGRPSRARGGGDV